jgi:hypothetical protein
LIISTHIPRAGGRSFEKILRDINGTNKVLQDLFPLKKDGAKVPGLDPEKWFPTIIDRRIKVIHGHNAKYWKWNPHFPNAIFISWVRSPVDRIISAFFREKRLKIKGGRPTDDFTEDGLIRWARAMGQEIEKEYFPPGIFEKYSLVGVVENYKDHSDRICKKLFGKTPKSIPHISKNVDNKRNSQDYKGHVERLGTPKMKLWGDFADDPKVRSKIADLAIYEVKIYEKALNNWEDGTYEA